MRECMSSIGFSKAEVSLQGRIMRAVAMMVEKSVGDGVRQILYP
jgi:hypothetical protein